jgi:N-methylhydantoinase A
VSPRREGAPNVTATRPVWWANGFVETPIIDMVDVHPGHEIDGPAILEAESTTFAVPPDRRCSLDEHRIFHLQIQKER